MKGPPSQTLEFALNAKPRMAIRYDAILIRYWLDKVGQILPQFLPHPFSYRGSPI